MRRDRYDTPDERGAALLIAVAALSLVALLGAVLMANAQSEIRRAERLVDRSEGDQLIEIAVAAAWGEIVGGETRAFSDGGTVDTGEWTVRATPTGEQWILAVQATTDGDVVDGRVTIAREPSTPHTLTVGDARTGPLSGAVDGLIAIRGDAVFSGRSLGDVQELIGPDATCAGCDNPVVVGSGAAPLAVPDLPSAPCPEVGGTITGTVPGGFDYACTTPGVIVIDGSLDIDGSAVLTFGTGVELRIDGADIQTGADPTDLFIRSDSSAATAVDIVDSTLVGILSVPDGQLRTNGFRWSGTVDAASLRTADGSELTGSWSDELESLGFAGWRVVEWDTSRS